MRFEYSYGATIALILSSIIISWHCSLAFPNPPTQRCYHNFKRTTTTDTTRFKTTSISPKTTSTTTTTTQLHSSVLDLPSLEQLFPDVNFFSELGQQLADALDTGGGLLQDIGAAGNKVTPEYATSLVLDSMGRDLLVFLTASVFVVPLANILGITPILGFLVAGAILGPHGLDTFSNSKADVELGDFGILFLLFSEGLEVTSSRLQRLTNFLPLGLAQISLSSATLSAAILNFPELLERFLPSLDAGLINVRNPSEALVLSFAGTLSTSAFIFPVLKERGWEEDDAGQAATSILLLQDLAVAPLLVLLPYVVGQGETDYAAIAFLTMKAIVGFGSVIVVGSWLLRYLFQWVAQTRSTETFVALCLLVSAGMGSIAKMFGLTDTAGAFCAGVLLANTNYRAQIQADIAPFKGILLGIFFMDAGSAFDTGLVYEEWPTIVVGSLALLGVKALTLLGATRVPEWMEPNRLPKADGIRISLLLSGGGEFAFVVLALAEKLQVLPSNLGSLLTAIVLITMGLTPVLGSLAATLSEPYVMMIEEEEELCQLDNIEAEECAPNNAIVICGYNDQSRQVLEALSKLKDDDDNDDDNNNNNNDNDNDETTTDVVVFDTDPSLLSSQPPFVYYGDGANPQVICNHGITNPRAIWVSYEEESDVKSATSRLRTVFRNTPMYEYRRQQQPQQNDDDNDAPKNNNNKNKNKNESTSNTTTTQVLSSLERVVQTLQLSRQLTEPLQQKLQQVYNSMDQDYSGLVEKNELTNMLIKSNAGTVRDDDEILKVQAWIDQQIQQQSSDELDFVSFCQLYLRAPRTIQESLMNYLL